MRVVMLVECGSRAPIGADAGPCGGKGRAEQSAARRLYRFLDQDVLLLADRNRHNQYPVKKATDVGARHAGSPTLRIANLPPARQVLHPGRISTGKLELIA
jgi:hypothetical protein